MTGQAPTVLHLPLPLIGGGMAVLSLPIPLSQRNYDHLTGLLDSMLGGVREAIVVDAPPTEPHAAAAD